MRWRPSGPLVLSPCDELTAQCDGPAQIDHPAAGPPQSAHSSRALTRRGAACHAVQSVPRSRSASASIRASTTPSAPRAGLRGSSKAVGYGPSSGASPFTGWSGCYPKLPEGCTSRSWMSLADPRRLITGSRPQRYGCYRSDTASQLTMPQQPRPDERSKDYSQALLQVNSMMPASSFPSWSPIRS